MTNCRNMHYMVCYFTHICGVDSVVRLAVIDARCRA